MPISIDSVLLFYSTTIINATTIATTAIPMLFLLSSRLSSPLSGNFSFLTIGRKMNACIITAAETSSVC
jgi:hypothetical protein